MSVGERGGEFVAVGGRESERLPEGAGAPGEEPGAAGTARGGVGKGMPGEASPHSGAAARDGDTPDQRVTAVGARLPARAADDVAVAVPLKPEAHGRGVEPRERQVGRAEEAAHLVHVCRPHALEGHDVDAAASG